MHKKVHKKHYLALAFYVHKRRHKRHKRQQATAHDGTTARKNKENVIVWELSDKEKAIINQLG